MSRDVAYRNGYLPLFAGAELVRRSGSLTQFPAENLIGTLPTPVGCSTRMVYDDLRVPVPPVGVSGMQLSVYGWIESTYRGALETDPELCGDVIAILDAAIGIFGALTAVPEGDAVPSISDPANWFIELDNPAVDGVFTAVVSGLIGGVTVPYGNLTVSKTALGVVSIDTSGITGTIPATFSNAGLQQLTIMHGISGGATGTWWPPFSAQFTPSTRAWVECLTGVPCAA